MKLSQLQALFFFIILLLSSAAAAETAQRMSPADKTMPEGYGAVLMANSQTVAMLGADLFLFRRIEDGKVFSLEQAFSLLLDGSPSRRVFLLPPGHYYFQRMLGMEMEGEYMGVGNKDQAFEILAQHINYIGQWTINAPQEGGVSVAYPASTVMYFHEVYGDIVDRYPFAVCEPGKPASIVQDSN